MKIITFGLLSLIAAMLLYSLWQIISGTAASSAFEVMEISTTKLVDYGKAALPSGTWLIGLFVVVFIGALPLLFGLGLDGKGQSASGWLLLMGAIFSAFAVTCLLAIYLGGSLLYALFNWIF